MTSPTKWGFTQPALTEWRLRVRLKMFRISGNTGGKFEVGISGAFGNATIDVTNYAAGEWHDIEVNIYPYSYSTSQAIQGMVQITQAITGSEVLIGELYIDELGQSVGIRQKTSSSAYTLKLDDNGKHIYISSGGVTIPNNADVEFPIETTVVIVNNSGSTQTISKGGSVTLYLTGSGSKTSLTLAAYGVATLLKVGTNTWYASGSVT